MNKEQLNSLLDDFDLTGFLVCEDWSEFMTPALDTECCPDCGDEVEIRQDGKSNCPECGHKNVLPCANCPILATFFVCDWDEKTHCSVFPKEVSV
ncbi:MAG TPA: hypothetical protein DEO59_04290 [Balneola sp.]|nr:hypothetical protein [Balneola sp.]